METTTNGDQSQQAGVDDNTNPPASTQDTSQSGEPTGSGTDSQAFTQIDREQLTSELQQRWDQMNTDYTSKTQALADRVRQADADRQFAAVGKLVEQNPAVNKLVWDAVNRLRAGESLSDTPAPATQATSPATQDQMSPEEAAGRRMIQEEIQTALKEFMPQIMNPLQSVMGVMHQNQARTEYELLVQKYPAAKAILPNELEGVRLRYKREDNSPISLEEAFIMMAGQNPALLTAKPDSPPGASTTTTTTTTPPSTERSTQRTGGESFLPGTPGHSKLREMAHKLVETGTGSVSQALGRAAERFGQAHPDL